jgi:FO synthase
VVLDDAEALLLFDTTGVELEALCAAADEVRADRVGETVTYVVNRNINFTNVCYTGCRFCAFAQRRDDPDAYTLSLTQVADRAEEAWELGATEVCMQGGIHPDLPGESYFELLDAVLARVPDHPHPRLLADGGRQRGDPAGHLGPGVARGGQAARARVDPGTAAEILDDEVRWVLTKGKLPTAQWIEVVTTAHEVGLRSSSTMMYGHVDEPPLGRPPQAAALDPGGDRRLHRVRAPALRAPAGPIYLAGVARPGSTWEDDRRVHAVARLLLQGAIDHVQLSWVKVGLERGVDLLRGGCDDLGGTLMEETISRMAGSGHGVRRSVEELVGAAAAAGRPARQRTTLYGEVPATV